VELAIIFGSRRRASILVLFCGLANSLEKSYLNICPGQIVNVFLQDIHIPLSQRTPLPDDIKRMIAMARKFNLKFTGLSIGNELK
jgi:hypothetical protein